MSGSASMFQHHRAWEADGEFCQIIKKENGQKANSIILLVFLTFSFQNFIVSQ